ncbi:hypothetical protein CU254_02170 [Amycolatopsis sp. AA4]|uniref:hypothetical protein n=1 Tax=Actinomycetes TaxID=1760 RepID=UPI0001B58A60|nr:MULTISPECIES: hypothetical protein [Actinomycetes]ATY09415.1 hypothetical protein CU254_02170 [Amycolatopsis sp. AA4]EFL04747.1 predicted protein [Streptomyces sp. AA4]
MPSEPESAPAAFTRAGQDAVTFSRRVAGTALARSERHRSENRELLKEFGRRRLSGAAEPAPSALRGAARRFRAARGLPMPAEPAVPEPVPVRPDISPEQPRTSEEDEDFSQSRIMSRDS